jgi:hypothetical protein
LLGVFQLKKERKGTWIIAFFEIVVAASQPIKSLEFAACVSLAVLLVVLGAFSSPATVVTSEELCREIDNELHDLKAEIDAKITSVRNSLRNTKQKRA